MSYLYAFVCLFIIYVSNVFSMTVKMMMMIIIIIIIIINVSNIPGNYEVKELQKTAILGTAHIFRKVLT